MCRNPRTHTSLASQFLHVLRLVLMSTTLSPFLVVIHGHNTKSLSHLTIASKVSRQWLECLIVMPSEAFHERLCMSQ